MAVKAPTRAGFSVEHADRACNFFRRVLRHSKGEWAGQPFDLLPWERDRIIRPLFGMLNASGYRQYRTVYCEIPRKAGKSSLAAGVALYLTTADGEAGAEVYGAASDRDQATIVYNEAANMVRQSQVLTNRLKVIDSTKRIIDYKTGSFYRAIPADAAGAHGYNAHGIVIDELHVQPNRDLYDVLTTSTGARRQPVTFLMTTAGYDRTSLCWEIHDYAQRVLRGEVDDPSFLAVIFAADETDEWTDSKTWYKANPSLGFTVQEEFYRTEVKKAKEIPAYENTVKRLYLNLWTSQDIRWLAIDKWDASTRGPIVPESLEGRTCYGGLDLASTTDIAAWVLVFPREPTDDEPLDESALDLDAILDDIPAEPAAAVDAANDADDSAEPSTPYRAPDRTIYDVLCRFWIPDTNIESRIKRDRVPYDVWVRQGLITATPGDVIDYGTIQTQIVEDSRTYNLVDLGFDRWGATQIVQNLADESVTVVPVGQGYQSLSPPTKELLRLVIGRRIEHGGNPVLRWMADNVRVTTDAALNVKPDKAKSRQRIDGVVAMVMALDRAIRNQGTQSVYEERGLTVL